MNYNFKINGEAVSLKELFMAIHDEIDGDVGFHELMETSSITINNKVYSIEKTKTPKAESLSKDTLRLATFCTFSVLSEDTPDGLPDKYVSIFRKLGDELQYEDLSYDDIANELLKFIEVTV